MAKVDEEEKDELEKLLQEIPGVGPSLAQAISEHIVSDPAYGTRIGAEILQASNGFTPTLKLDDRPTLAPGEFLEWCNHLRFTKPPPPRTKVVVRRVDRSEMEGYPGTTSKSKNQFLIRIDNSLTRYETQCVLIHEWAHVMDWHAYGAMTNDHGATFGVHWASTYQAFYHER